MTESPTLGGSMRSSMGFAPLLAQCSLALARRFSDGATLWCVAPRRLDHGLHIAVEFVHPVIVGKRALPAVAVTGSDPTFELGRCVRPGDAVICVGPGDDADIIDIARSGPQWGVETTWIGWGPTLPAQSGATLLWLTDGEDSSVVRAYHLLWELTHVCLEQPGVLRGADGAVTSSTVSDTSFLYPFLEDGRRDPHDLLVELAASAEAKTGDSDRLIDRSLAKNREVLEKAAVGVVARVLRGGRVLAFGNGGSACDSIAFVNQLEGGDPALPVAARTLAGDPAILSALSNDVGTEQVFARQIEAFAGPDDTAVAFSTSGQSPNILRALRVARRRGLLTIVFAGYGGGALSDNTNVDHGIIVDSQSVHRIQEAQARLSSRLRTLIANHGSDNGEQP